MSDEMSVCCGLFGAGVRLGRIANEVLPFALFNESSGRENDQELFVAQDKRTGSRSTLSVQFISSRCSEIWPDHESGVISALSNGCKLTKLSYIFSSLKCKLRPNHNALSVVSINIPRFLFNAAYSDAICSVDSRFHAPFVACPISIGNTNENCDSLTPNALRSSFHSI